MEVFRGGGEGVGAHAATTASRSIGKDMLMWHMINAQSIPKCRLTIITVSLEI